MFSSSFIAHFCRTYRSINEERLGNVSAPSSNLDNTFQLIEEMRIEFEKREAIKQKNVQVKEDIELVFENDIPKLKDVYMRPSATKRLKGNAMYFIKPNTSSLPQKYYRLCTEKLKY